MLGVSIELMLFSMSLRIEVFSSELVVCLLPEVLISQYGVPFYFGGTSLLIVVSVTMDTSAQIQSHLIAHQYEGLIKKSRLRGARRSWVHVGQA